MHIPWIKIDLVRILIDFVILFARWLDQFFCTFQSIWSFLTIVWTLRISTLIWSISACFDFLVLSYDFVDFVAFRHFVSLFTLFTLCFLFTLTPNSLVMQPPKNNCPVNFGFMGSDTSYWRKSPWSQQDKYKYLSSMDIKISVNTAGISGKAQPDRNQWIIGA